MGDAAGELDDLDATGHLAPGVLQDLAVLGGDQPGQVVTVRVGQLAEGEQDPAPCRERGVPPRPERLGGRLDGVVDVLDRGENDLGGLLAGRRVEDGGGASRGPFRG